ncbi:MAG TPA: glycoside hydrolase family 38 [Opitutaceae bacterium]|nr:glycoside hydrolase family 38 [Opitutaceae bacterium]
MPRLRFHLIANAHLDPVWLWDWREGLNEGLATCRAVLDLMERYPELTFVRGEASVYKHIERHDPETFARIRAAISAGKWDVVGGNFVQPDTNLPATEVLLRQFTRGLGYFSKSLGVRPTVAWAPDSFGHSAGWPEIYAAAGMQSFAFSRPFESDLKLPGPAFWWEGAAGSKVLAWRMPVGWYGSTRTELPERLDRYKAEAPRWGLQNVAIFFGLGNHGGGPSRAQIETVLRWRDRHPEVDVEFSTLHRFFASLARESENLKTFRGELNFALRGCYASMASFKFAYRRTENRLLRAERISAAVALAIEADDVATAAAESTVDSRSSALPACDADVVGLREAWDAVLFNTFHDVLPGTSIERAFIDQHAWIGLAAHQTQRAELNALNALAARIDTRVPPAEEDHPTVVPLLVWNSRAVDFDGPVEFEVPLDYRPIDAFRNKTEAVPLAVRDDRGKALRFQTIATEHDFASDVPWRKRFVTRLKIPAFGWRIITAGWEPAAAASTKAIVSDIQIRRGRISNQHWRISASPGRSNVAFARAAKPPLNLRVLTIDDPWGSWGGHDGEVEAEHINHVTRVWKITALDCLERGPERAALAVKFEADGSWLELTILLHRDDPAVVVRSRVFWSQKAARLKLEFSAGGEAEFEVPGGTIRRAPCGEVPGGRWVKVDRAANGFIFASDAIYNFDSTARRFSATVLRSSRYAANERASADVGSRAPNAWRPYTDLGEHVFQFALADLGADPAALAQRLEAPPLIQIVTAHAGKMPRSASVLKLSAGLQLLAFLPARTEPGSWVLRAQNLSRRSVSASVLILGEALALGRLEGGAIRSWLLHKETTGGAGGAHWSARETTAAEEIISREIHS